MKTSFAALGLIAGLAAATISHAQVNATAEVGTTGFGFHAGVPIRPDLQARFGTGYLTYSYSGSTRDLDYDLDLKANTYDALVDWFPRADSNFRLSAGLAYNANKIDVHARPNAVGSYTIGGNTYNPASVGGITGRIDFNKLAPYLGIGWGRPSAREKGWSFSTDIGVLYQGSPKSSLNNTGCTAPAALCQQFANDVARENATLADEVSKYKFYPVLRFGLNYRF